MAVERRAWLTPWRVWQSLPGRVLVTTIIGATAVLLTGAFLIMNQVTSGVLDTKKASAQVQANSVIDRMQNQLNQANDSYTPTELLNQLAYEAASSQAQYHILIEGPVSDIVPQQVTAQSVPAALSAQVQANASSRFITPTTVHWTSGRSSAGLAFGASLHHEQATYPIFLIFPEDEEITTLQVLQRAVITTSFVLLLILATMSWIITRAVVQPVRYASRTAGRLAAGELNERMDVRGTNEIVSLARSMNDMASELQQQIIRLEELSRVQQQFVSDVSHELRTPLTTVRMAAELLYEGREDLNPSAARSTELMHDELDRFESLLSDLLEISRFDAGAAVLSLDDTDVAALVQAEVDAQAPFAERMHTPIRVHVDGEAVAEVDPRRIQRIIRNLVTNAIEHGDQRAIDVTVAADDQSVAVVVRDHGLGFEPDQSCLVFNRFWRGDPSRSRMVGGTGLGLAISLEDALLHDGWLSAWGGPGQGAQFRLTLPRRAGQSLTGSPLPATPDERLAMAQRSGDRSERRAGADDPTGATS